MVRAAAAEPPGYSPARPSHVAATPTWLPGAARTAPAAPPAPRAAHAPRALPAPAPLVSQRSPAPQTPCADPGTRPTRTGLAPHRPGHRGAPEITHMVSVATARIWRRCRAAVTSTRFRPRHRSRPPVTGRGRSGGGEDPAGHDDGIMNRPGDRFVIWASAIENRQEDLGRAVRTGRAGGTRGGRCRLRFRR